MKISTLNPNLLNEWRNDRDNIKEQCSCVSNAPSSKKNAWLKCRENSVKNIDL